MRPVIYQLFLFGLTLSEWVEITKVVNKNKENDRPKIYTTPATYEEIVTKPKLYEFSLSTSAYDVKTHKNASFYSESDLSTLPNLSNSSIDLKYDAVSSDSQNSAKTDENEQISRENNDYIGDDKEIPQDKHKSTDHVENEENPLGFISMLKQIQNNLFNDFKGKSLTRKISLLKEFQDHFLLEIKTRISTLWSPIAEQKTEARGFNKDYDHQMDFPSNEGALMTIGFLTFAVFLIKLVLKLIHTLKYKQYYYQTTTTTAASVFLRKREIAEEEIDESAKILQYIEEYPLP